MTNVGAITLLKTYKKNSSSAIEEIDISVSAAKAFSPQHLSILNFTMICILPVFKRVTLNICSGNLKCYVCALYAVRCV